MPRFGAASTSSLDNLRLLEALDAADLAAATFIDVVPTNDSVTIASGMAGVFSGFASHARRSGEQFDVDPREILFELAVVVSLLGRRTPSWRLRRRLLRRVLRNKEPSTSKTDRSCRRGISYQVVREGGLAAPFAVPVPRRLLLGLVAIECRVAIQRGTREFLRR